MQDTLIGLISATSVEGGAIRRRLKKKENNFYTGKIGTHKIVHAASGIGKANASHTTTLLIEGFSPSLIINFGIGGAYPSSGLGTGDIAVAEREIYGDEGLWLKDGFHTIDSIDIPLLKKGRKQYFNEFMLDRKLIKKVMDSNRPVTNVKYGRFVTVSTCTGTSKRAKELEKRFNAICENMEGAAVAHICAIYGIPMLEIRGISNIVEDRDKDKWDIKTAAENCRRVLLQFLESNEETKLR